MAAHCTRPKPSVTHVDAKEKGSFDDEHHWNTQACQTCTAR